MSDRSSQDDPLAWSFDELLQMGLSLIPAYAPDWTNHNPSDPGITLVELLAYISEILIYRALRVTPDAKLNLLRLLAGPAASGSDLFGQPSHVIDEAIRRCAQSMARAGCAVTPGDFERIARALIETHPGGVRRFRLQCLPQAALRRPGSMQETVAAEMPTDVSLVVTLEPDIPAHTRDAIMDAVQAELNAHCLLTSRAHVVAAVDLHVGIGCRISPIPGVTLADAADAVDAALRRRFDILEPTASDDSGPFGRTLHLAQVAAAIDRTPAVDYVEDVVVRRIALRAHADPAAERVGIPSHPRRHRRTLGEDTRLGGQASVALRRLRTDHTGEADAVLLQPWEVAHVQLAREAVEGDHGERLPASMTGAEHG